MRDIATLPTDRQQCPAYAASAARLAASSEEPGLPGHELRLPSDELRSPGILLGR
ncbi:MAG: hypothetical protein AW07_02200 [Candidatus Accumulibacter sp. SK-11]|nr:MAG: hypothetical protein AW07_02200 [Candidatus Accumulibacter sp. SK-11]